MSVRRLIVGLTKPLLVWNTYALIHPLLTVGSSDDEGHLTHLWEVQNPLEAILTSDLDGYVIVASIPTSNWA